MIQLHKSSGFTLSGIHVIENLHAYLDSQIVGWNIEVDFDSILKEVHILHTVASEQSQRDSQAGQTYSRAT